MKYNIEKRDRNRYKIRFRRGVIKIHDDSLRKEKQKALEEYLKNPPKAQAQKVKTVSADDPVLPMRDYYENTLGFEVIWRYDDPKNVMVNGAVIPTSTFELNNEDHLVAKKSLLDSLVVSIPKDYEPPMTNENGTLFNIRRWAADKGYIYEEFNDPHLKGLFYISAMSQNFQTKAITDCIKESFCKTSTALNVIGENEQVINPLCKWPPYTPTLCCC